mgnify:CR=1 FL=1
MKQYFGEEKIVATMKEMEAHGEDKTDKAAQISRMGRKSNRFPWGSMFLWCGLSLVFFIFFSILFPFLQLCFGAIGSDWPALIGPMQYMHLWIRDSLFWKASILPLSCILVMEVVTFLLGNFRVLKSRSTVWILLALGFVLSGLYGFYLAVLRPTTAVSPIWSQGDMIVMSLLVYVVLAIFTGLISLSLYTMAASERISPVKHKGKTVFLSFAASVIPPFFLALASSI